jgi:hypothetical protein
MGGPVLSLENEIPSEGITLPSGISARNAIVILAKSHWFAMHVHRFAV